MTAASHRELLVGSRASWNEKGSFCWEAGIFSQPCRRIFRGGFPLQNCDGHLVLATAPFEGTSSSLSSGETL